MSRRTIFGWSAVLLAALGMTLAVPSDAHARRRARSNGYYGYTYAGRTQGYVAPVAATSPCAGTAAPMNPDGTIAPQPAPAAPANPPAPENAPAPAPPSAANY